MGVKISVLHQSQYRGQVITITFEREQYAYCSSKKALGSRLIQFLHAYESTLSRHDRLQQASERCFSKTPNIPLSWKSNISK